MGFLFSYYFHATQCLSPLKALIVFSLKYLATALVGFSCKQRTTPMDYHEAVTEGLGDRLHLHEVSSPIRLERRSLVSVTPAAAVYSRLQE